MLRRFNDPTVSPFLTTDLTNRWFLMDRAGRRPILLSGAAAMAVFLTLTGYWIYIDQAYTPNAGTFLKAVTSTKLTISRGLCHHLQRSFRNVMGSSALVIPSRDHAFAIQSEGCLLVDCYQLAIRMSHYYKNVSELTNRITGSECRPLYSRN